MLLLNELTDKFEISALAESIDSILREYDDIVKKIPIREGMYSMTDELTRSLALLDNQIQEIKSVRAKTKELYQKGDTSKEDAILSRRGHVAKMRKSVSSVTELLQKFRKSIDVYLNDSNEYLKTSKNTMFKHAKNDGDMSTKMPRKDIRKMQQQRSQRMGNKGEQQPTNRRKSMAAKTDVPTLRQKPDQRRGERRRSMATRNP